MTKKISIPLSEFDEKFLMELKHRYGAHTRLDIQLVELEEEQILSEAVFWEIIAKIQLNEESRKGQLDAAIKELVQHPLSYIYQFEDKLSEKLHQLDTPAHANAVYVNTQRVSADGFLYVRAGILAKGENYYKEALLKPQIITDEFDYEPILSLAALAYKRKTGNTFKYVAPVSYETYANEEAWDNE
ncbi:MAG: DUF4240 domain-containing protein [Bacteroidota bacterium]